MRATIETTLGALSCFEPLRPDELARIARRFVLLRLKKGEAHGLDDTVAAQRLIINELGVTLAFDIFFKDVHTADPRLAFDVERLYRRTEPLRAIAVALGVLVQAAYLRRFYRRVGFVLATRMRRLLSGKRSRP